MSASILESIHADPWADHAIDLESLNADASGAIEDAITRQRKAALANPRELRSTSLVVLGPPGAGKTHLFGRLRRRTGPRAVFVHVRPLLNSDMTARFVLHEIATQLSRESLGPATPRLRQIHALVGSLIASLDGAGSAFPATFLGELAALDSIERHRRLDDVTERTLGKWEDLDDIYLRRLLSVPFGGPTEQRAALAWLSGRECDVLQLLRSGAAASLGEEGVIPALRTIAAVASLGAPIVVVFDQLENLVDAGGSNSRMLAYANLAAELVDAARGMVLVHMAIDSEWARAIEPLLSAAQRSRIAMRTKRLELPTPQQRVELLQKWLEAIPNRPAPFPWPLGRKAIEHWCNAPGVTPRMLLVECGRALEEAGSPPGIDAGDDAHSGEAEEADEPVALSDALAAEWAKHLTEARRSLDAGAAEAESVDLARVADGFAAACSFIPGLSVAVKLEEPAQLMWQTRIGPLRVALLHQRHPRSLGKALSKLAAIAQKERVVALRERSQEFPPTWKDTLAKRAAFIAAPNASWADFEREDAARLLALSSLLAAARSGDVTDPKGRPAALEQVRLWVEQALQVGSWSVMTMIASGSEAADQWGEPIEQAAQPAGDGAGSAEEAQRALTVLARLRVVSIDRLVREVIRAYPGATRASTLAALETAGGRVRWIGSAVVFLAEAP